MLNIKQNKALTHPYFTKIKILAVFVPKCRIRRNKRFSEAYFCNKSLKYNKLNRFLSAKKKLNLEKEPFPTVNLPFFLFSSPKKRSDE